MFVFINNLIYFIDYSKMYVLRLNAADCGKIQLKVKNFIKAPNS